MLLDKNGREYRFGYWDESLIVYDLDKDEQVRAANVTGLDIYQVNFKPIDGGFKVNLMYIDQKGNINSRTLSKPVEDPAAEIAILRRV